MHHDWAVRVADELTEPALTCEAVLAEAAFKLRSVEVVLEMIVSQLVRVSFELNDHLPQLVAVALASFLYDRLDENGLPITLAGPGLRDSLRLAGSPYPIWRDIILTNREILSASLDLFARRLDEIRERLASRDLEADFDAANELYKLLRGI